MKGGVKIPTIREEILKHTYIGQRMTVKELTLELYPSVSDYEYCARCYQVRDILKTLAKFRLFREDSTIPNVNGGKDIIVWRRLA